MLLLPIILWPLVCVVGRNISKLLVSRRFSTLWIMFPLHFICICLSRPN